MSEAQKTTTITKATENDSNNHDKGGEYQDRHRGATSTVTNQKRKRNGMQEEEQQQEERPKRQRQQEERQQRRQQEQGREPPIQALLSVPLKYILRKTSNTKIKKVVSSNQSHGRDIKNTSGNSKKNNSTKRQKEQLLLSKAEASAFIHLSNLAHEIDVLLYMLSSALHKSHVTKELSRLISAPRSTCGNSGNDCTSNNLEKETAASSSVSTSSTTLTKNKSTSSNTYNYYLHPLQCILNEHGRKIPDQVIQHVQENIERILTIEFTQLYQILIQCSEQNWVFSNALLVHEDEDDCDDDDEDAEEEEQNCGNDNGNMKKKSFVGRKKSANYVSQLGRDKGILAELEEEVCRRMDGLVQMSIGASVAGSRDDCDESGITKLNNEDKIDERKKSIDIFDQIGYGRCKIDENLNSREDEFISMEKLCQQLFDDCSDDCGTSNKDNNSDNGDNFTGNGKKTLIPEEVVEMSKKDIRTCSEDVIESEEQENNYIFGSNNPATQNHTQVSEAHMDAVATLDMLASCER